MSTIVICISAMQTAVPMAEWSREKHVSCCTLPYNLYMSTIVICISAMQTAVPMAEMLSREAGNILLRTAYIIIYTCLL